MCSTRPEIPATCIRILGLRIISPSFFVVLRTRSFYNKITFKTDSEGGEKWKPHKDQTRDRRRAVTNRLFLEHRSLIDFAKTAAIESIRRPRRRLLIKLNATCLIHIEREEGRAANVHH